MSTTNAEHWIHETLEEYKKFEGGILEFRLDTEKAIEVLRRFFPNGPSSSSKLHGFFLDDALMECLFPSKPLSAIPFREFEILDFNGDDPTALDLHSDRFYERVKMPWKGKEGFRGYFDVLEGIHVDSGEVAAVQFAFNGMKTVPYPVDRTSKQAFCPFPIYLRILHFTKVEIILLDKSGKDVSNESHECVFPIGGIVRIPNWKAFWSMKDDFCDLTNGVTHVTQRDGVLSCSTLPNTLVPLPTNV